MIKIQSLSMWKSGEVKTANSFNLAIVNDNLSSSATLYYQIGYNSDFDEGSTNQQSAQWYVDGNISISGSEYDDWGSDLEVNKWIYNWALAKLNLVEVEYTPKPPVVTEPTPAEVVTEQTPAEVVTEPTPAEVAENTEEETENN